MNINALLTTVALLGYVISILVFLLARKSNNRFVKFVFYMQSIVNFVCSSILIYECLL